MCQDPKYPGNFRPKPTDPGCMCGKALLIYIPPGEHFHPCPVHPERFITGGPRVTC